MGSVNGFKAYSGCSNLVQLFIKRAETFQELSRVRQKYFEAAKDGQAEARGWTEDAYGMSNLFLQKHVECLGRSDTILGRKMFVAIVHPGLVDTGMMEDFPERDKLLDIEEGIVSPLYVQSREYNALKNGKFWKEEQLLD